MSTYRDFYGAVLTQMKLPVNDHTMDALGIVSILEGINTYWNPLNSVIPITGSKPLPGNPYNVQMFTDFNMGVAGTLALLKQPRWSWVLMAMKYAGDRNLILHEFDVEYRTWGSVLDWFQFSTAEAKARLALTMKSA